MNMKVLLDVYDGKSVHLSEVLKGSSYTSSCKCLNQLQLLIN